MGKSTTLIAKRTRVGGRIETDGDVVVEGRVEGSVIAGGSVTISEAGVAVAQVRAIRVEIEGIVIGDVLASERIAVAAGARVVGDLRAPDVALAAGAWVDGKVDRRAVERPGIEGHRDADTEAVAPEPHDALEPMTMPRARITLRDAGAPVVRPGPPGRPAARPATVTGAPPRLPRPPGRAKLVPRSRRMPST